MPGPELTPFADLRDGDASVPRSGPEAGCTIVAIAEIDRFLPLRARIGYTRANRLMAQLAERLRAAVPGAEIGRVGRNAIEFALTAPTRADGEAVLARARAALGCPVMLDGLDLTLSATIGAVDVGAGAILDAAVDLASATVVEAQRRRKRILIARTDDRWTEGVDDLALLRDMQGAMRTGALQVHYQPKLRIRTNRIDAAEALIRWEHPTLGQVPVEPFIRLLEETGGIRRLTEWVIARAVMDAAALAGSGHAMRLWVNLSGSLLADDSFVTGAIALIAGRAGTIGFEITETAVIGDPERAIANLARLSAAGIRLAIDDYGSGLSSLAYLKQLPAQELKIDRMFIRELVQSQRDPLLVRSSIDLAHALGMEVTAEGVDDPMALALLRTMGCDMVQGFILAPALPLAELRRLLDDHVRVRDITAVRGPGASIDAAAPRAGDCG